jgi:cytochrome c556
MRPLLRCALITLVLGCAPDKNTPIADIPKLTTLEEVMDNQQTAADPQFAKLGQESFSDADYAAFGQAAERLQATSVKVKEFARGRAGFEALAVRLNEKAKDLAAAAGAKDSSSTKAALNEMKATCNACHQKFR